MSHRILHCGKSLENYRLCIEKRVAGFINRGAETNDIVYIAVKVGKQSLCGAKAILGEITDFKPWEDSDAYVHCLRIKSIEFCQPFDLKLLSQLGGKYWSLKYLQGAKPIKDNDAIQLLQEKFESNKLDIPYFFDYEFQPNSASPDPESKIDLDDEDLDVDDQNIEAILKEVPDAKIDIMGTFQTVSFRNETDQIRGLERLVNENFYALFPAYPESRTILISDNRKFITSGLENNDIKGIRGIPDALLLVYEKEAKYPIQINLIEYECYGEQKTRALEKNNYLNGHIIPQLMKFASTFSVVTDKQIREDTAKKWANKLIDYIYEKLDAQNKITSWIKDLNPGIPEQRVALYIYEMLTAAFKNSLRVVLVIDELSAEQRSTISNVINAFKLENGESIAFKGYVVRLEQRITLVDGNAEYALSIDE